MNEKPDQASLGSTLQTLREFILNNTEVLDKVHLDDDSVLSDELHYALYCLDMAAYHLHYAIAELEKDSTTR